MVDTFLMLFPACALFVAVAVITERVWRREDNRIKRGLFARFYQAQVNEQRRRSGMADERPLAYLPSSVPWKHEQWWKV